MTYRFFVGGRWRKFDLQNILEVVQDAGVRVPANRPQTAPSLTLINHMQMSLQRHWGTIRRHSPPVFKKHLRCFMWTWDLFEVRHLYAKTCRDFQSYEHWYRQNLNGPWAGGSDSTGLLLLHLLVSILSSKVQWSSASISGMDNDHKLISTQNVTK